MRSPFLSWPMVVRVHMVSPLTTMPAPPPSGSLSSAAAVFAGRHTAVSSRECRGKRLCAVCATQCSRHIVRREQIRQFRRSHRNIGLCSKNGRTRQDVANSVRRPWCWLASYGTAPHGNMKAACQPGRSATMRAG